MEFMWKGTAGQVERKQEHDLFIFHAKVHKKILFIWTIYIKSMYIKSCNRNEKINKKKYIKLVLNIEFDKIRIFIKINFHISIYNAER